MLRVPSTVSPETDSLIYQVIGCCITVHRALGPGLPEIAYSRAVRLELQARGIEFETEKEISVTYRGHLLCIHRLDLVVARQVVLELKAVEHFTPVHHAQLLSYLAISRLRVGLLVNFNVAVLQDGIKRIVFG